MFVVGGANKRQAESGSCNNTIFLESTLFLVYSKNTLISYNNSKLCVFHLLCLLLISGILQAHRQYDNIFIGAESDHCIDLRSNQLCQKLVALKILAPETSFSYKNIGGADHDGGTK